MKLVQDLLKIGSFSLSLLVRSEGNAWKFSKYQNSFNISSFLNFSIFKWNEVENKPENETISFSFFDLVTLKKELREFISIAENPESYTIVDDNGMDKIIIRKDIKSLFTIKNTNGKILAIKIATLYKESEGYYPGVKIVINDPAFNTVLSMDKFIPFVDIVLNTDLHILSHSLFQSYKAQIAFSKKNQSQEIIEGN